MKKFKYLSCFMIYMSLDELDKNILNALIDNSRLSYRQIAKKLGVSVATVMHRVNILEKEKVIKRICRQARQSRAISPKRIRKT